MNLGSFVDLLESRGLVNLPSITDNNDNGFANRFKIQKYVYISKFFGLNLGYNYSIYRYGPYSPRLAEDYYELAERPEIYDVQRQESLPNTFEVDEFLNLISNKDNDWLEIATTLLDQSPRFNNDNDLVNHVESIKCDYPIEYIGNVLDDLRTESLVS